MPAEDVLPDLDLQPPRLQQVRPDLQPVGVDRAGRRDHADGVAVHERSGAAQLGQHPGSMRDGADSRG
ncbi:hypothetical protein GCM10028777_07540 [Angustibacter speluncae]